jgi:hypothetical protein
VGGFTAGFGMCLINEYRKITEFKPVIDMQPVSN